LSLFPIEQITVEQLVNTSHVITEEQLKKLRHDLRTPINQILGYSELLIEVAEDEGYKDVTDDLQRILHAGRNMLSQLESITADIAGAQTGQTEAPTKIEALQEQAAEIDKRSPALPSLDIEADYCPVTHISSAFVLVVDDNDMNRDMLSRRLRRQGHRVNIAVNGWDALDQISRNSFDIVLLDVMMPGLNGLEVLAEIRKSKDMTRLPVIMATARGDSEDIVEALKLGANDYVTKPIDFAVVLARMEAHLRLKLVTEEVRQLASKLEKSNQFVRSVFGRYLSDEIVENILDAPEGLDLGGSSRVVTILMSDIRGFSSMSETIPPEDVVRLLNQYLGAMTDIIHKYQGTIDEFIGDAILVIFGAPNTMDDHADRAIACALEMQMAMMEVNERNSEMGLPIIEMGIGINTGPVVVGNIGSEKRSKYAVVGRHVNMAARIESYTVGGQVLISDETVWATNETLSIKGNVKVSPKGSKEAFLIHNVCGIKGSYNLQLQADSLERKQLLEPISIKFGILDGINIPKLKKSGEILAFSEREAELMVEQEETPLLANITLELAHPAPQGKVIGKVTQVCPDTNRVLLRFSTIPDQVRDFLFQKAFLSPQQQDLKPCQAKAP